MAILKGKVVSDDEAKKHGVLVPTFAGPAITGQGTNDWHCGKCDHLLANKTSTGQFQGVGIKCFECGSVNILTG